VNGQQIILGGKTTYKVEYYFDNKLDSSLTLTLSGNQGDIIGDYPKQDVSGFKFSHDSGMPIRLLSDPAHNVIRVYYVTGFETLNELMVPLGTGSSLSVGDTIQ
jgi:hypothetical protein